MPLPHSRAHRLFLLRIKCSIIHLDMVSVYPNLDDFNRPVEGAMKLLRACFCNFIAIFKNNDMREKYIFLIRARLPHCVTLIPFRTQFTHIHLFQCKLSKRAKEIKKMVIILGLFDGYFTPKPDSYATRNSWIDKPFQ